MMETILNEMLFYYKTKIFGNAGDAPQWLSEKETALFELLELDNMDIDTCDQHTGVICDLEDAEELYGFTLGIKLCLEVMSAIRDA